MPPAFRVLTCVLVAVIGAFAKRASVVPLPPMGFSARLPAKVPGVVAAPRASAPVKMAGAQATVGLRAGTSMYRGDFAGRALPDRDSELLRELMNKPADAPKLPPKPGPSKMQSVPVSKPPPKSKSATESKSPPKPTPESKPTPNLPPKPEPSKMQSAPVSKPPAKPQSATESKPPPKPNSATESKPPPKPTPESKPTPKPKPSNSPSVSESTSTPQPPSKPATPAAVKASAVDPATPSEPKGPTVQIPAAELEVVMKDYEVAMQRVEELQMEGDTQKKVIQTQLEEIRGLQSKLAEKSVRPVVGTGGKADADAIEDVIADAEKSKRRELSAIQEAETAKRKLAEANRQKDEALAESAALRTKLASVEARAQGLQESLSTIGVSVGAALRNKDLADGNVSLFDAALQESEENKEVALKLSEEREELEERVDDLESRTKTFDKLAARSKKLATALEKIYVSIGADKRAGLLSFFRGRSDDVMIEDTLAQIDDLNKKQPKTR